jgi:hypothetical protein
MRMDTLEACPPRQPGRPSSEAVGDRGYSVQVKSVGIFHVDHELKFVGAVRAENEFPLKKDRLYLPCREEKILLQKILIVLQSDF